jgi:glycosyltransferase involved in cell wall biosynthesis
VVRRALSFALPGDLATPTGGYVYDRRIVEGLKEDGWDLRVVGLGDNFPFADERERAEAGRRLAALPPDVPVVIDGLALGVLPEAAAALRSSHCLVALVHHPLALETGLSQGDAGRFRASERNALAHVRHVIVTSEATARLLAADYDVPAARLSVVQPGTDRAPFAEVNGRTVSLLAVGSIVPRKGYDILVAALAMLRELPWRLVIVGDTSRDTRAAQELAASIRRQALEERIVLTGAVPPERVDELYAQADAFVLPSRFEGYGMAFAEALAHGLPIVATRAGAVSDIVPKEAAMFIEVDDVIGLATALRRLIENGDERRRLARGARQAAASLPTWEKAARRFGQTIEAVA